MSNEKEQNELFLLACARGLLPDVEGLLRDGVDPKVRDKAGRSGVHFAAARGELPVLELLHSKGCDLDAEDGSARSALHYAAMHDRESVLRYLVDKGCWMDAYDEGDSTPLHLAARNRATAAIRRLLLCGAKTGLQNRWGLTPLGEAVCAGDLSACAAFANNGAATHTDLATRHQGYTLLHVAAGLGEPLGLDWLLKQKALDVNDAANDEKLTPLHCAVLGGNLIVVEMLCKAGADRSLRTGKNETPLYLVSEAYCPSDAPANNAERIAAALRKQSVPPPTAPRSTAVPPSEPAQSTSKQPRDDTSAAARLAAARDPEEVAAVMQELPKDHQTLRIKKWAALSEKELASLKVLTARAKKAIAQVRLLIFVVARKTAADAVRKNERFQADMREKNIRGAVDAVIADPDRVMKYTQVQPVMTCLDVMRRLRDVNKANGGGAIDLDEILKPWTPDDDQRVQGMHAALEGAIDDAIAAVCHPSSSPPDVPDKASALQVKDQLGKHAEGAESADHGTPSTWGGVWQELRGRLLQHLVVIGVLFLAMWWQGMLPYQRRARQLAQEQGLSPSYTTEGVDSDMHVEL